MPTTGVLGPSVDAEASPAGLECPDSDALTDWDFVAVDSHRFGAICVGMTFTQAAAAEPGTAVVGERQCPWVATLVESDGLFIQAITDPSDPDSPIRFFRMIYEGDPAKAPPHEMPATAEGISIGSLADDVPAVFPAATQVRQDDPSRGPRIQWVVEEAADHYYVFDVADGYVVEITWGVSLEGGTSGELCGL
ncbi:MAG: hypothetical protein ACK5NO_10155 [Demequina sp.]